MSWPARVVAAASIIFGAVGCSEDATRNAVSADEATTIEATSLDGRPLHRPALPEDVRRQYEAALADARAEHARAPGADTLIWVGRRTAYLGRYREAIAIFGEGIASYPRDARFLRHRGHRYLTTRQLELAVRDLEAAASLIAGKSDTIEPDGLPNARGMPTSTLHTNVYYHLGLAHYLRGDDAAALDAWRKCLAASRNPDMEAATRYWLYLAQRRLRFDDEATANLAAVDPDWDIIENHAYHRLLLRFRGDASAASTEAAGVESVEDATFAYGLAQWHRFEGRDAEADALLARLLEGPQWASFGYLAAEADRARRAPAASPPQPPAGGAAVAAQAREPFASTAYFAFHSDPRYALHDALLAAAREARFRRPDPYASACMQALAPEARAGWSAAVRELGASVEATPDFSEERIVVREALVTGRTPTLESQAVLVARVSAAMDGARDAWMRCHWPALDAANRRWVEAVLPLLEAHAAPVAERLQALFERRWRKLPIPVDLVGDAGWAAANTFVIDGGAHVQVRSTHVPYHGHASLEILFHEASHELVGRYNGPIAGLLRAAADEAGVALDDDLWHGLLFVSVGEVVEQRLRDAAGIEYASIARGVFRGGWARMQGPLREHWLPVVRGESTRAEAARKLVADVAKAPQG